MSQLKGDMIFRRHKWNDNPIQLSNGKTGTRDKNLVDDHSWSKAHYTVIGSGLHVDFNFVTKLKHGSSVKQTFTDSDGTSFFHDTVHLSEASLKYYDSKDTWHYSIQYSVTNII